MMREKQLVNVELARVVEKRRLDQALNTKEFAVLAGISYSTARAWFRQPGFPAFSGVVFWQDFVRWRSAKTGLDKIVAPLTRCGQAAHASQSQDCFWPVRSMCWRRTARNGPPSLWCRRLRVNPMLTILPCTLVVTSALPNETPLKSPATC